jgi:hypothetical protein
MKKPIASMSVADFGTTSPAAAKILAGLVAGVWTSRRAVPWSVALLCVVLGIAGAVAMAVDSSDDRVGNVVFGIGAGLVCAGLVWLGYALGRISRRTASPA